MLCVQGIGFGFRGPCFRVKDVVSEVEGFRFGRRF